MLNTLEKKADPSHAALVIVDVQNDFCAVGGMMHREGNDLSLVEAMVPRLLRLIDAARRAGVLVVYIQSIYGRTGSPYLSEVWLEQAQRKRQGSYTTYGVCEEGSWNFEFFGGIDPRDDELVVHKHRYSAFQGGDLDVILRSRGIRAVILTGVATNVCVETTAREAFVNDYHVVLVDDCSATYRQEDHDSTLRNIDNFFGEVTTGQQLAQIWRGGSDPIAD